MQYRGGPKGMWKWGGGWGARASEEGFQGCIGWCKGGGGVSLKRVKQGSKEGFERGVIGGGLLGRACVLSEQSEQGKVSGRIMGGGVHNACTAQA